MANDELRGAVQDAWRSFRSRGWEFARMLAEVADAEWFLSWNFPTLAEWAKADLGVERSALSRYVDAGRFYLGAADERQQRLLGTDLWTAAEALSSKYGKAHPDEAFALATSGKTQAQIRHEIRASDTDQHHDVDYRTFTVRYPVEIRDLVQRALNRARFECGQVEPSPASLFECILSRFVDEPLERESDRLSIEAGEACCTLFSRPQLRSEQCGGWNRNVIDRHHVQSRSMGGGKGPVVALCRSCHQKFEDGGKWRELAQHLGYDEIASAPYGGEKMWGSGYATEEERIFS